MTRTSKRTRVIKSYITAGYSLIDVSEQFEELKRIPAPIEKRIDTTAWESLFHEIPQEQLEVFVCLYLGMKPKEVIEVLCLDTISRFYNINAKLKRVYRQQKWRVS